MKRLIFEWSLVIIFLGVLGYVMRLEPIEQQLGKTVVIATDLPEPLARTLLKDYQGSYELIVLPVYLEEQWPSLLQARKADLFFGSQDMLLWAARRQYLQPLKEEFLSQADLAGKDGLGRWVGLWADPWVVAYNPERMMTKIGEKKFSIVEKDFFSYRWVFPDLGNLNGDMRNFQLYEFLTTHYGEEDFYKQMNDLRPSIQSYVENTNYGVRMVLLGQADLALAHYSDCFFYQKEKMPLRWFSLEMNPAMIYGAGIAHETKQWDEANKILQYWQNRPETWEEKNKIPWVRLQLNGPKYTFEMSGLEDKENQRFFDKWLAEFRFGGIQKGIVK